jgi:transcriptional regulator with XRE-family HTH domain
MKPVQPLGIKIKRIRKALNLTREEFASMLAIPVSTLKNYELQYRSVSSDALVSLCSHPIMHRYTIWLMSNRTNLPAGQVEPPELKEKE